MSPICKINPKFENDMNLNSTNLLSVVFPFFDESACNSIEEVKIHIPCHNL